MNRITLVIAPLVLCTVATLALAAEQASSFPSKAVRLVVPFPPGGGTDAMARVLAAKLGALWEQSVVVENKGGAGGTLGSAFVARAPADGYTLILGNTATHAINASLYKNLGFDLKKDFRPIAYLGSGPHVLAVYPRVAATTVAELVALGKRSDETLNYASFGSGSTSHLAGEMMKRSSGIGWTHVPYRGTGPAVVDLIGGQVQAMFVPIAAAIPYLKSGQLRGLAVTGSERSTFLPALPTMMEVGFKGFEASLWYGIFAPAATPSAVAAKITQDIQLVLQDAELRESLAAQGLQVQRLDASEFAAFVRAETEKWAKVVSESGATVD
jgi:tripartite-type tricarboxylate transporter receptor subunit TctC